MSEMNQSPFRCPETGVLLRVADDSLISRLESERSSGRLRTHGGQAIVHPIEAGLVREDGRRFYPIRGGVPILLIEESIEITSGGDGAP